MNEGDRGAGHIQASNALMGRLDFELSHQVNEMIVLCL